MMKTVQGCTIMGLLLAGSLGVRAENPIIPGQGVCDPQLRVFGDRVWLYATHDYSVNNKGYSMSDWWVWSSADLVHWTHESTLRPQETYYKKGDWACWATDAATRNGQYYFYFSMGANNIGVVVGDTPKGPWRDPLGKPLVAHGLVPTMARDPGILMEDDGQAYMVFGTFRYFIGRLKEDMISFAEKPREITVRNPVSPCGNGKTDDKPFLHKHGGKYYLSWGCYYAMADQLYGPYTNKGCLITRERTAPEFQTIQWSRPERAPQPKTEEEKDRVTLTHDRHGSFFEYNNQWYYACNDMSQPGSHSTFRNSVLCYLHYRDNGEMEPVFLNRMGVGQYDAAAGRIEAENYFKAVGAVKRQCPAGGYELRELKAGSYLVYPRVMNLAVNTKAHFRVSRQKRGWLGGGEIEVRSGGPEGALLGRCKVPSTGGWETYQTVECRLKNKPGTVDICLVFKGVGNEFCRLDWMSYSMEQ